PLRQREYRTVRRAHELHAHIHARAINRLRAHATARAHATLIQRHPRATAHQLQGRSQPRCTRTHHSNVTSFRHSPFPVETVSLLLSKNGPTKKGGPRSARTSFSCSTTSEYYAAGLRPYGSSGVGRTRPPQMNALIAGRG